MAAIMVIAGRNFLLDNNNNDHLKTRKGQPVSVWGPDQTPGLRETSPNFVLVEVTDATIEDLTPYLEAWTIEVAYEVLSHDLVTDTYNVRAYNAHTAINPQPYVGRGMLTGDQITNWLSGWGITPDSIADDNVVFTATIYNVIRTRGFWKYPGNQLSNIMWSEVSYDQETGVHRIQADYTNWNVNTGAVEKTVTNQGGIIVSHQNRVIVFDISRTTVIQLFQQEVKNRTRNYLRKNRYYFTDAVVDNIIANDGIVSVDMATFQTYLRDRLID